MTGKERMVCAFSHKEADYVPVGDPVIDSHIAKEVLGREAIVGQGGYVHMMRDKMLHEGRRDEYVTRYKEDTVALFKNIDVDFLVADLMPPKNTTTTLKEIRENTWRIYDDNGFWTEYSYDAGADIVMEMDSYIQQDEGYDAIERYLDIFESNLERPESAIFETTRYCKENLPDKFLISKFPALFAHGADWYEKFLMMFYEVPEMTQRLFDLYLKRALLYVEELAKIGVDCLYVAGDWAGNTGPLMSPSLIRQYMVPQIVTICDLAHQLGMYVIKHTDGNIMKIADDFFNMGIDAFQSVEPHAGMSLKVVKEGWGDRITFLGNVDCGRTLVWGTEQEIADEVKQCISDAAKGGGFVLTSSNTINAMIPPKNFFIMLEAARKYGKYPISV